jgi:hypothetical protein
VPESDAGPSSPLDKSDEKKKEPRRNFGVELTTEQYNTLRDWGSKQKEDRVIGWYIRRAVEEYITRRKKNPPVAYTGEE